jgi:predicted nucleotidyltransferase
MQTEDAISILRRHEGDLRARGVRRAALFGSLARGDGRPDSDIDIMVEIEPEARITVFDYVELKDYIAGLFDRPVDVVRAVTASSPTFGLLRSPTQSMRSDPAETALRDILRHIDLAAEFVAGVDGLRSTPTCGPSMRSHAASRSSPKPHGASRMT